MNSVREGPFRKRERPLAAHRDRLPCVVLVGFVLLAPARAFALDRGAGSTVATVVATGEGNVAIGCDGGRLNA